MMTAISRTLRLLRRSGLVADVVERWVGSGRLRVRRDLLGGIDVIAFGAQQTLLIQVTTRSNVRARIKKLRELPQIVAIDGRAGRRVEVWGWAKRSRAGARKRWTVARFTLDGASIEDNLGGHLNGRL